MHAKEKVNCKKKRLFDISFVQNDKEKPTLFVFYPGNNKRSFLFAALTDVVLTRTEQI